MNIVITLRPDGLINAVLVDGVSANAEVHDYDTHGMVQEDLHLDTEGGRYFLYYLHDFVPINKEATNEPRT